MNRHFVWGTVTVVALILIALTVLALNDKSTTDLLVVVTIAVLPVLAAFGVQIKKTVEEVRDISNGNLSKERVMYDANLNTILRMLAETHPNISSGAIQSIESSRSQLTDSRSADVDTTVYTRQ